MTTISIKHDGRINIANKVHNLIKILV